MTDLARSDVEAMATQGVVVDRATRIDNLLPRVKTDLFQDNQDAQFWVGQVGGLNGVQNDPDLFASVAQLRANVYIDEKHYLGEEVRQNDGTESDEDDLRSIQFAAFENLQDGLVRTVASGRMILKATETEPLPIEKYFPEVFEPGIPTVGSIEISRFISRHPNRLTQHIASLAIIRAMAFSSSKMEVPTNYCIIEKPLLDMLNFIGLPVVELGEAKDIPEQNGVLYPIDINPHKILERGEQAEYATLNTYFADEKQSEGQGFYAESLTRI